MRIMVDTNVLISALLFPGSQMDRIMVHIMLKHKMVISSYVIDEFKDVVRRKFPKHVDRIDALLKQMSYELAYTPDKMDVNLFAIRDAADYPVLYTAMIEGVDILVTGDKDFADVDIDMPEIMTPRQFIETHMS